VRKGVRAKTFEDLQVGMLNVVENKGERALEHRDAEFTEIRKRCGA